MALSRDQVDVRLKIPIRQGKICVQWEILDDGNERLAFRRNKGRMPAHILVPLPGGEATILELVGFLGEALDSACKRKKGTIELSRGMQSFAQLVGRGLYWGKLLCEQTEEHAAVMSFGSGSRASESACVVALKGWLFTPYVAMLTVDKQSTSQNQHASGSFVRLKNDDVELLMDGLAEHLLATG